MGVGGFGGQPGMASVQHPFSRKLPPGHEQQQQQQQCGGATNCSHKRRSGSAPTGMHNMLQAHNHHKDVSFVDEFPHGMRVLVVNDDPICLRILEWMLH
jgi:spore cortex formation protein SpoVR/YcgB (stage V sporulation)